MLWTSYSPFLIWGVIVIPFTTLLWLKRPTDYLTSLFAALAYTLANLFFILTVNWSWMNYWLRLLPVALILTIAIVQLVKHKKAPFLPEKSVFAYASLAVLLVLIAPAAWLDYRVLQSFHHEGNHVLGFLPVRNGLYVIVNGGNGLEGLAMNNLARPWFGSEMNPDDSMAYGIDIMRMGIRGSPRISGRTNRTFQKYEGYNDMVYSPCNGQVVFTEDGHPDVEVYEQGTPLGNYVVIQCDKYFITIGNLKNGSIQVKPGDKIIFQINIGNVGNSGIPAIPHVHMHATVGGWKPGEGQPVPMLFPGLFSVNKFFVRNDLAISNKE